MSQCPGWALLTHPLAQLCQLRGELELGTSGLRGEAQSPPLPKAPSCRSLVPGPLQRAVAQAQPHQGTVVPQQLQQLLAAAASPPAARPCGDRGALALLLQDTARGERGAEPSWDAFGQPWRHSGLAGLSSAEAAGRRALAGSAWCSQSSAPGPNSSTRAWNPPLPWGLGLSAAQQVQDPWDVSRFSPPWGLSCLAWPQLDPKSSFLLTPGPHPTCLTPVPHLSPESPEPSAKAAPEDNFCHQQLQD